MMNVESKTRMRSPLSKSTPSLLPQLCNNDGDQHSLPKKENDGGAAG